jgi:hypothetical protein
MYNAKHDAYGRVMQPLSNIRLYKEKTMFNTAETLIDTFTTAQKQAIKFVQNEAVAKSLTEIVDAQAQTAKTAVKVGTDAFTTVGKEVVKTAQEAAKYDYSKHFTDFAETFTKAFAPAKAK